MEVVSTSETLLNFYQTTWCNIPEDNHFHTCHCENLKSHPACLAGGEAEDVCDPDNSETGDHYSLGSEQYDTLKYNKTLKE
jgi:hypothetical protein